MQLHFCTNPETDYGTKARIVVCAEHAYVAITETNPPASSDWALPGGCSATDAIRKLIQENDADILRRIVRNDRLRRALHVLNKE